MPTTVIVVFHAVNVEPTLNLFLAAKVAPMIATSALEVGANAFPEVSFSVPPPFAPPTRALPGLFVPMTRMGIVKVPPPGPVPALPPKRPPSDPVGVGVFKFVVDDESSSLSATWSEVTFFRSRSVSIFVCLSGVPPPLKPKKPLGATVIVVPEEAFTELIFEFTASRAMSIEIDKVIATARMTTTPIDRMEFRKALRTPRRTEFTGLPFKLGSRQFVDDVKAWLQDSLSER
jgi:hypothetical protein